MSNFEFDLLKYCYDCDKHCNEDCHLHKHVLPWQDVFENIVKGEFLVNKFNKYDKHVFVEWVDKSKSKFITEDGGFMSVSSDWYNHFDVEFRCSLLDEENKCNLNDKPCTETDCDEYQKGNNDLLNKIGS